MRVHRWILASLLPLGLFSSLSAEALPPKQTTPAEGVSTGERWSITVEQASLYLERFPELRWWEGFADPQLNQWVEAALAHNLDLQQAQARLNEAKSQARQALGREFPLLEGGIGFTRQRNSENILAPGFQQFQGAGPRLFAPGQTVNLYTLPLTAQYELDVFWKNRLTTRAAQARSQRVAWLQKSTLIRVIADTVTAYIQWVQADAAAIRQAELIRLSGEELRLMESRARQGLISALDMVPFREALFAQQRLLPQLEKQRRLARNQLAVLTGQAPQARLALGFSPLATLQRPTSLSAGVPSELVLRRPDLLAAEADLRAATLDVRVARRALFPSLMLTGQVNLAATSLNQWWDWDSLLAAVGTQALQTLWDGGQRRARIQGAKARSEQALLGYRQAILQAFLETEDALARHQQDAATLEAVRAQLGAAEEQARLLGSRHRQGLIPYQETLPTARRQLSLRQQVDDLEAALLLHTVSLYKALGGGVASPSQATGRP